MNTIIDLSHVLNNETPVYPGTVAPSIQQSNTIQNDGFREKSILIPSHFGTHMDAPSHIFKDGKSLDQFPVDQFSGRAVMLDVRGLSSISEDSIASLLRAHPSAEFVILRTGWEDFWHDEKYFEGFPVLSEAAAECLASHQIKGIGLDAISVDPVGSETLPVHRALLKSDLVIVENLCNLGALPSPEFIFQSFPLKIGDADGSPVRAVAVFPEL